MERPGGREPHRIQLVCAICPDAERGKFDFMFLAEGLRLREQNGQIYELDVVGRPDTFTVLAALAAVTERLGLAAPSTRLSMSPTRWPDSSHRWTIYPDGRAAWNVVTSWDGSPGRISAAADSWPRVTLRTGETFLTTGALRLLGRRRDRGRQRAGGLPVRSRMPALRAQDRHFDVSGRFNVPRSPQGRPVIFQAGDSDQGRDFAAAAADASSVEAQHSGGRTSVLRRRKVASAAMEDSPTSY